ncbi:hypothetical protein B0H11DRAFT_1901452 [Mycena galericulata]|nr:hypothetical protein B0H11DRAFT_1915417 [Mycena galericulata]KAJ7509324.1 hypothetical protein B0H11DRAFT_1901452 [Mycena galericulata]
MARPSRRTQQLRKSAQRATKSRKTTIEEGFDSDPDDSGPAAMPQASTSVPLVSHDEHSDCGHDHHSPPQPNLDPGATWDFDFGNELPDLDCDVVFGEDREPGLDDEVIEAPEISDLKSFATLLSDAQEVARVRARANRSKRPKHYTKNSKSTKYRKRKKGEKMQERGFVNVLDFIRKKQKAQETEIINLPANNLFGAGLHS